MTTNAPIKPPELITPSEQIGRYHELVERLGSEGRPKVQGAKPADELGTGTVDFDRLRAGKRSHTF